ncbi:hypothetical protein Avbf_07922 [Armadillidium vulgare]|nr:hypothetical protein Avbf_07922 [Armadillidium vulgare]
MTFGESFCRNGAMFRGDPPDTLIQPVPPKVRTDALGCTFHVQVKKVTTQNSPQYFILQVVIGGAPPGSLKIKLFHQVRSLDRERLGKITLFKENAKDASEHHIEDLGFEFSLPDKIWKIFLHKTELKFNNIEREREATVAEELKYKITILKNLVRDQFILELVNQRDGLKSMLGAGSQSFECSGNFDFLELANIKDETATIVKTFLDRDTRVELTFMVRVTKAPHFASLGVLTGPFTPTKLDPVTVRSLYGIVPNVERNCETQEDIYKAEMATHRYMKWNFIYLYATLGVKLQFF